MPSHTFDRGERLKSRKEIQRLFRQGNSFAQFPLRLIWLPVDEPRSGYPVQFALSVPKRKFRKAVLRNRIKRQMREAYRLHKHRLYRELDPGSPQIAFMVLYTASEPLPFARIEEAMIRMMRKFLKKYDRRPEKTN